MCCQILLVGWFFLGVEFAGAFFAVAAAGECFVVFEVFDGDVDLVSAGAEALDGSVVAGLGCSGDGESSEDVADFGVAVALGGGFGSLFCPAGGFEDVVS